jgi:hypothetical protein
MMQKFKQLEAASMPSLRVSLFGGEGVPVKLLLRAWQAAAPNSVLDNQYGPDRGGGRLHLPSVLRAARRNAGRGTLAIGRPFPGMQAAIVAENDPARFLPVGHPGRASRYVGHKSRRLYLGDDAQTACRFRMLDHPISEKRAGISRATRHTWTHKGLLHCLGRHRQSGQSIGPTASSWRRSKHICVTCVKPKQWPRFAWPVVDGNPAGIVALRQRRPVDAAVDVREAMKNAFRLYMVPSRVHAREALAAFRPTEGRSAGLKNDAG